MSVDHFMYIGTYISLASFTIKRIEEVDGCPKCKCSTGANFCPTCGTKVAKYEKKRNIHNDVRSLFNHAATEGVIDDQSLDELYDSCMLHNTTITPNETVDFGESLEVGSGADDFEADFPARDDDKAREFFAKAIVVLDHYGVKYSLRHGISYYTE